MTKLLVGKGNNPPYSFILQEKDSNIQQKANKYQVLGLTNFTDCQSFLFLTIETQHQ